MPPNSHDRADFMRAICAAPDDDAPRLIYADWLDENGADEQAAFIREQIRLARLPCWHPDVLEANLPSSLDLDLIQRMIAALPPLPDGLQWMISPYRCGFPGNLQLTSHDGIAALDHLCREVTPARCVWVPNFEERRPTLIEALLSSEVFEHVVELMYTSDAARMSDLVGALHATPFARRLRELSVSVWDDDESGAVAHQIVQAPLFRQLEAFHYAEDTPSFLDRAFWDALARTSPDANALRELRFENVYLSIGDMANFANTPQLHGLRELELRCANGFTVGDYWGLLPNSRYLQNLEVLRCHGFVLRSLRKTETLAAARMPRLRLLDLCDCALGPNAFEAFHTAPFIAPLTYLDLEANPLEDHSAKMLAQVPFTQLALLNLRCCQIENDGALALANAPFADKLRLLDLSDNNLDEKTEHRLRDLLGPRVRL